MRYLILLLLITISLAAQQLTPLGKGWQFSFSVYPEVESPGPLLTYPNHPATGQFFPPNAKTGRHPKVTSRFQALN